MNRRGFILSGAALAVGSVLPLRAVSAVAPSPVVTLTGVPSEWAAVGATLWMDGELFEVTKVVSSNQVNVRRGRL
jgi:hypothetical protein